MGLSRWKRFWSVDVPGGAIGLVWNGMMSFGGSWFFLTASELIIVGGHRYTLPGVGSYVGVAVEQGRLGHVVWGIITMIIMILAVNFVFWRPLVATAERFRLEQTEASQKPRSIVLGVWRRSSWPGLAGRGSAPQAHPEFEALVDQIYRMMTQRDDVSAVPPAPHGGAGIGAVGDSPLPQATVDGLSGLAEILLGRHDGAADLADMAEALAYRGGRPAPLVDALVLLGFAELHGGRLALSGGGRDLMRGASIRGSIGFMQTHGRRRTQEAISGLEIVPRRQKGGHGDTAGMDLDAVLARRPAVVLVDDFGQNAAAISSLRNAGIDVISTVDVGDLDRAAGTVAEFTGRPPTTTVPDAALAQADDIRFVDNSPEALRKRLGHGNIYPADQVGEALAGVFSTASLAALRETGLQVVAETLAGPGSARPHRPLDVLVAVADGAPADVLLQRGVRLSRRDGATCTVLVLGRSGQAPEGLRRRGARPAHLTPGALGGAR